MNKLIIIGAGGHGKSVAWVAKQTNRWDYIHFLDDRIINENVIGKINDRKLYKSNDFFIAVGDNFLRKALFIQLKNEGYTLPSIISPTSSITNSHIGDGSIVMNNCFINVDSIIGECVIINNNVIIEHECIIGDFISISPSVIIGGKSKISDNTFIGLGSIIINNIEVTQNVILGAGSIVNKSLLESGTYVGAPVKKIERSKNNLIIVGAGGFGKSVYWTAVSKRKWQNVFFLDDKISSKENPLIIDNFNNRKKYINDEFIVAVGDNFIRKQLLEILWNENYKVTQLISNFSNVTDCKIESGVIILNNCFINSNSIIGKGVVINNNVYIGHDCLINDFSHLSPSVSIAGNVSIGNCTWIGLGANVIENITIDKNIIIGAGGVVVQDLFEAGTYVGVPVKKIK